MRLSKTEAFIWLLLDCPACEAWGETQDHDSTPHVVYQDGSKKSGRVVWHGFGEDVSECEFLRSLQAFDLGLVKMDTWVKLICPCGETLHGAPETKPLCQSCFARKSSE